MKKWGFILLTAALAATFLVGCEASSDTYYKLEEQVTQPVSFLENYDLFEEERDNKQDFEYDKNIENEQLLNEVDILQQNLEVSEKTKQKEETTTNSSMKSNIVDKAVKIIVPKQPSVTNSLVGYNDRKSWWFKRNAKHIPPSAQQDINIDQYGAYYLGNTEEQIIYLTFDEGYENGHTEKILDILDEKGVKAAFFVTKPYIKSEPELVKRMVSEGHIVGNHSVNHPDMTTISDEQILKELEGCAQYFEEITGVQMPFYFRPPEGVYSVRTLEKTQAAGYKTIFWSFAYKDWDVENQPGKDSAYNMVMDNYHNGSIMLLHAVSKSNTEALGDIIDGLSEKGYRFGTLNELPQT